LRARLAPVVALGLSLLAACSSGPGAGSVTERRGDEIVAAGRFYRIGAPVVLFSDPGGYDAYRDDLFFPAEAPEEGESVPKRGPRYGARPGEPEDLEALSKAVDLFVLHYDAAGTARQCFKTLQDRRGLSVHFLLDLDGTLYQTLDLKERAWHAGDANDRSVGVEIANVGAYPERSNERLRAWYASDAAGPRVTFPPKLGSTGIRTEGFVARPARRTILSGKIHGRTLYQFDFTNEQYAALAKLARGLSGLLPRLRLDAPRDRRGVVRRDVLTAGELAEFSGVLGHWHVTKEKVDPGPAFDWERLFRDARP